MTQQNSRIVRGVCPHDCPDACGMVISVRGDKATSLRGDREHPFTQGFLCQKVARYLDRVYHPDRLKFPLRRSGPKGKGRFERMSWEAAIREITDRFRALAAEHGPQVILPYSYAGTMGQIQGGSLDRRFFHRLGASLLDRTICATAGCAGSDITLGTRAFIDPELVIHSRLIVNWGSNTSVTNSHLWAIMHRARKAGATIVTIDPYRSPTAARSDWWIPIRPGTDAALALGIMHVIWREGRQDDDYLEKYCLGADQLRERVQNEYAPGKVAAITGLDESHIERLAQLLIEQSPSLIRLNYGMQRHRGGGMAVRTVCCIPAVIGSWRQVGGGALLSTSKQYPFNTDELQRPDLIPPNTRTINMVHLADALNGRLVGPPIKAIYVYNSNPASVNPDQGRVIQGLMRNDLFVVVHEQFLTDTARYADIVLPATTQLEHFDIHGSYGHLYVQTNEPAIAPLAEAKPNTEVFRLLAHGMGFEPDLFEHSDEELARLAIQSTANDKRFPSRHAFDGISFDRLRANGPMRLNTPKNDAPFAHGEFDTPSGRCELYSPGLASLGLDPLPAYTPPNEDPQTNPRLARRFPIQLITPPHPAFLNSTFANLDQARQTSGPTTIELCLHDCALRGLVDGETVRAFNDRGGFNAVLQVSDNVKPGVAVSLGCRWSADSDDGSNSNSTTSTAITDFGGGGTFFDNLVEIERVAAKTDHSIDPPSPPPH